MPNEQEVFGAPQVLITFKTKATTAIARSVRGIVVMILKNEKIDTMGYYKINDVTDIPAEGLTDANVDLIKKCLLGTPLRVLVYTIPDDSVESPTVTQASVLKQIVNVKWNYICNPTGDTQDMEDLASWIKTMRNNKHKTFKAVVANQAADDKGVVNFCTGNIRVLNPEYTAAEAGSAMVGEAVVSSDEKYITYSAAQYTARIAGILAGLALDRSATYYQLDEVVSCEAYEDIDSLINDGQLLLFDEQDGNGVKIARACNSLTTFTTDVGEDFRYIKIVECIDMITDDIRDTFKTSYIGKYINDYDHKMNFINAILIYFKELKGNVLDNSPTAINTMDIDVEAQKDYATLHGDDPSTMTDQQIREYNTGTKVMLEGRITPVNAMEDLTINFMM
ncbi:phage tail sheath subtilisin-like domain-containing protein [Megasphaera elsdenii]|uniref:phage tail sheath subtilisin-like domain-containing protein n=1 Tax=Megasphaera elsdenii TaxID=907 RepID=UPI002E79BF42|nr:phage tail sheath subtilisin-like domain-containing protein [Megasphaera elsdenii]MEE0403344.1 phage tail sheath C-terminal domain-containing protein [Megasphaera elsdenii]